MHLGQTADSILELGISVKELLTSGRHETFELFALAGRGSRNLF